MRNNTEIGSKTHIAADNPDFPDGSCILHSVGLNEKHGTLWCLDVPVVCVAFGAPRS